MGPNRKRGQRGKGHNYGEKTNQPQDEPAVREPHADSVTEAQSQKSKANEAPRSTHAEKVIAGVTVVLAFVGIAQVGVGYWQWNLGRDQLAVAQEALRDSQTPHVRMWVGELTGFHEGITLETAVRILNTGEVTLFNGKVSTAMGYGPVGETNKIWGALGARDTVVMGPDDEETYPFHWDRLTPVEVRDIKAGKGVVIVAGKIEYPDPAGRTHNRYICNLWWYNHGNMIPSVCSTPPQS